MSAEQTERRLAAIMFTDIVGYTALMAESEAAGLRARERHRQLVRPLVEQHHGESIEARGDESLSLFPSALDAVRCALAILGELEGDAELSLHLGIHLGDVMVQVGEVSGDGVNIASRICSLSEGGGLCVSGEVYQAVRNQPGMYSVTGKVEPPQAAAGREESAVEDIPLPGMDDLTVPGFGGAPAIAVLPFDNLSGDPEQEYFADGLAEDLITRLSAWRGAPVIARNSSFVYKGRSVDIKQGELGVRYVVEGSVRRAGGRVRVAAQLIDATTGAHVWAERYDRDLRDLFDLQDEITESIDGALHPELERAERERIRRREVNDPDAYDRLVRGTWHYFRLTRDDNARARALLEEALRLEPRMAVALAWLAFTHHTDIAGGWSDSRERSLAEMTRTAQEAIAADPEHYLGHLALGVALRHAGQLERARAAVELAIRLNPSFALAYSELAMILLWLERPAEAIPLLEKAMRLSPQDPFPALHLMRMGLLHAVDGQYEEAVDWIQRSIDRGPFTNALQYASLAGALAALGRVAEAREAVDQALRIESDISIAAIRRAYPSFDPDRRERFFDSLRKAGLPEE